MPSLDELMEQAEDSIEKGGDLSQFDTEHHGKAKHETSVKKAASTDQKIKQARMEKNEQEASQENLDDQQKEEGAKETVKEEKTRSKKATRVKQGKAKVRSQKYNQVLELIEKNRRYDLDEALELVKKTSMSKFDGNAEVHIRLVGKSGKPEQLRGLIQYPFSTGKKISVVVLDEKNIDEIAKSGKVEADIYLTSPALMPQVAKLAKILGPKGKMPNPKSGTITVDPAKTKAELEGGKVEYKTDSTGNVHQVIGKVSAKTEELASNYKILIDALPKDKIVSIHLCATMGPSVKVQK